MEKGAAQEDIPPPRRREIEQPGPPVKGKPPINGGVDAPLTDSPPGCSERYATMGDIPPEPCWREMVWDNLT